MTYHLYDTSLNYFWIVRRGSLRAWGIAVWPSAVAISRGTDFLRGAMFTKKLESVGLHAEKAVRDVKVSLNVGVIIASVALLVATVALVVAVQR